MSASRDLARRAVACKAWRWMPGMLDTDGVRYCTLVDGRPHGVKLTGHASMVRGLPDLDDPATLGCLLALVREAWPSWPPSEGGCGEPAWVIREAWSTGWVCGVPGAPDHFYGATEAEALVAALEAAP